jgi:hypothetical protein
MLLQPTEGHIYFAEFDVMKSVAASLEVAYSNRFRAADTEAEKQWWDNRRMSLPEFTRDAVDTDRDDLVLRTRLMREEFLRIGGLAAPERD